MVSITTDRLFFFLVNRILWHRLFCGWLLLLYIIPVQTLISVMCGSIHSFPLLHIIPLCECITTCPFYCWWVIFSPVWSYEHLTAGTMIIFVHSFSWKQQSFFLDMYPGVALLGQRVGIYLALAVYQFPQVDVPFHTPRELPWGSLVTIRFCQGINFSHSGVAVVNS